MSITYRCTPPIFQKRQPQIMVALRLPPSDVAFLDRLRAGLAGVTRSDVLRQLLALGMAEWELRQAPERQAKRGKRGAP